MTETGNNQPKPSTSGKEMESSALRDLEEKLGKSMEFMMTSWMKRIEETLGNKLQQAGERGDYRLEGAHQEERGSGDHRRANLSREETSGFRGWSDNLYQEYYNSGLRLDEDERNDQELQYSNQRGRTDVTRVVKEKSKLEKLKFNGDYKAVNSKKFVQRFEEIVESERYRESEKVHLFTNLLEDDAKKWAEIIDTRIWKEMKRRYLGKYWSTDIQRSFIVDVAGGKFQKDMGVSREMYFIIMVSHFNYIDVQLGEEWFVYQMIHHYDEGTRDRLETRNVKTIDEMIRVLSEKDRARILTGNSWVSMGNKKDKENKPVGGGAKFQEFRKYVGENQRGNGINKSGYPRNESQQRSNYYQNRGNFNQNFQKTEKVPERRFPENSQNRRDIKDKGIIRQMEAEEMTEFVEISEENLEGDPTVAVIREGKEKRDVQPVGRLEGVQEFMNAEIKIDEEKEDFSKMSLQNKDNCHRIKEKDQEEPTGKIEGKSRPRSPRVNIQIGERTIAALLDTGAEISVISQDCVKNLEDSGIKMHRLPTMNFQVLSAFGDKSQAVKSQVLLSFKVMNDEYEQGCVILDRLMDPMILGFDFISRHKGLIDLGKKNLILKDIIGDEFQERHYQISPLARGMKHQQENGSTKEEIELEPEKLIEHLKRDFSGLFEDRLGKIEGYKHVIKMSNDRPYKQPIYPIPRIHLLEVRRQIKDMEDQGVIKKADTEFINPMVVVEKENGKLRLCLDAREIKKGMSADHAKPILLEEVFHRIEKAKWFSKLDIKNAFWQIELEEECKLFTGFILETQTYVFNRLPFGLKTSGASFTRAISTILGPLLEERTIVYLDDILIATETLEGHTIVMSEVLRRLQEKGVVLNSGKCEFLQHRVKLLGHHFEEDEAKMTEETKQAIISFSIPKNRKAVQSFLGLANWDRRFIPGLTESAKPIELLLKKETKFKWGEKEQQAFEEVKKKFKEADKLSHMRPDRSFGLETDASTIGLGARLFQLDDEGIEYTIAYASRSLKEAERNYTTTELECLAVVWAVKKWRTYLLGHQILVRTDHKALIFMRACVWTSRRVARWQLDLQEFDLKFEHIKGEKNVKADALSRFPIGGEQIMENKNPVLRFIIPMEEAIDWTGWTERIQESQQRDEDMRQKIDTDPQNHREIQGMLQSKVEGYWKIMIPEELNADLIEQIHKFLVHCGTDKVLKFADFL